MKKTRMGIDEAGRGSLIGPMVIAAVILDEEGEEELKNVGVRDSKTLSPSRREKLEKIIKEKALWYKTARVYPETIDKENLNRLTLNTMRELAKEGLRLYPNLNEILVDQVGHKPIILIKNAFKVKQTMEEKADSKYVPVAAASILAKTERDRIISFYKKTYGLRGSGYPSDPETIKWVKENWESIPKEIVRIKWKTLRRHGITTENMGLDKYLKRGER
jgi:ribonuclease HII